jgi:CheY-like chemotaxis protein
MSKQLSVVVVHDQASRAIMWAESFEALNFRTMATDSMVSAIGAMRRHNVDAMISFASHDAIARAETFLAEGEDLPLCVVVASHQQALGLRSRAVIAADADSTAEQLAQCIRAMLTLVVPDDEHRRLPLKTPGRISGQKFTAWLTAPGRKRTASGWS